MILVHGTHQEHMDTIKRAKDNNVNLVWTGDLRRNEYIRENLSYCTNLGMINIEFVEEHQASYFKIKYNF